VRHHPYKLYGVVMLAVIAALVALSVLFFKEAFTPFDHVRVHVARAGLQLLPGSDVKVRGLIVGSVEDITSDGDGADILLRLDPDQAKRLPRNVTVRMLPKTVFGEKYVDLVLPQQPQGHLADGVVIDQDQTRTALEIDQALNDLLPVLRTVSPVELNNTLSALSTALGGRGEQLGQTIEQLDRYLRDFDPHLPQLHHDLAVLGKVSRTYAAAADPLIRALGNVTVTSDTIVAEHEQLARFLTDVATAADRTGDLLLNNDRNIIRANHLARPVLSLLARYSPEFGCFFRGYAKLVPRIHDAVPKTPGLNHAAHVVVEFVPSYPTYSNPIDLPEFKDKRGPHCYGLPDPPMRLPVIRYKDGTEDDPRFDTQGQIGKMLRAAIP
jgi:phospholipid/cholesterol/gamma-HCH transport system substrate-binding protein